MVSPEQQTGALPDESNESALTAEERQEAFENMSSVPKEPTFDEAMGMFKDRPKRASDPDEVHGALKRGVKTAKY